MLRFLRHGIVVVVCTIWPVPEAAAAETFAELDFQRIDATSGLSHNSVYTIHQDRRGLMWFGTADGLNRYDGYEMVVHRHVPGNPHSLPSNTVTDIEEDAQGRIWVATAGGIARLDEGRGRFVRYPRAQGEMEGTVYISALLEDARGGLWAASSRGLLRYQEREDRFVRIPLPDEEAPPGAVFSLAQGPDGDLWLDAGSGEATDRSLYRLEPDGSGGRRYRIEGSWSHNAFLVDSRGRVWGNSARPAVLDEAHETASLPPSEILTGIHALWEAPDGAIWLGGSSGLRRVAPDGRVRHVQPDPHHRTWLHNYVRSIYGSRSGILWVGTYSGVYRHDPHAKAFFGLRHEANNPDSLSGDAVSAIAGSDDGGIWVGTFGSGLDRLDSNHRTIARYRHRPGDSRSLPSDVVWALEAAEGGGLWVGTQRGLARYRPDTDDFEPIPLPPGGVPNLSDERVTVIVTADDGRLWLARGTRLTVYDPASGNAENIAEVHGSVPGLVESILPVQSDLWLGLGTSLDLYRPARGELERHRLSTNDGTPLTGGGIWDLHLGSRGDLWLATSSGLLRFDRTDGGFHRAGVEDGLPGSVVYSIAEDDLGRLWLGTNRGLCRFDPSTLGARRFRTYDQTDGLMTMEFNRHADYAAPDGTLYFGGVDGLVWFDPEAIRNNQYVPPVVLTRVEVGSRGGTRAVRPRHLGRFEVAPGEETLAFEFAALNFTDPEQNRYAYQMEGFDDGWVEAGHRRFARYTQLPPGDYTFRVRGSNNDGVWNLEGTSLAVTIRPAFRETRWFRGLLVLALAGLLYALHRYRLARLLEMERLRVQIAGDLHDDLSSDLSGIALTAETLARQADIPDDERRRLDRIRGTAARLVDGIRDMVWSIDPEHDTLEATVRRLRSIAERMLAGVAWDFRVSPGARQGEIDPASRRNLVLIFKEALHNAARHAEADRIDIRLDRIDGRVVLEVRDDGVGFAPSRAATGHGLASMERRAREIGADLAVDARPREGTTVRLEVS